MRLNGSRLAAVAVGAAALLAGCGGDETKPAGSSGSGLPQGDEPVKLDPAGFSADVEQPLLADEAGHPMDLPGGGREGQAV